MKLKSPLDKHYNCKRINKYKEGTFEENDKYIMITSKTEGQDEGIYFVVKDN